MRPEIWAHFSDNKLTKVNKMRLYKTSEKVMIWMKRNNFTQDYIALKLGITRQTLAKRIQDNFFSVRDIIILKSLGFKE